ncbi:MAG: BamA/TamA family outer membrane protein [bacterium]|nr:BamA/TamA family outer membrane protein [bacterium]
MKTTKLEQTIDAARRRTATGPLLRCAILLLLLLSAGAVRADEELDFGLEAHRLHQIRISGQQSFSENELKALLHIEEPDWRRPLAVPTYKPHLVATQLRILRTYYRNRGFHQAQVALDSVIVEEGEGDVLHISIAEGARTMIAAVKFTGNEPLVEERLRQVMILLEGLPAPADLNAFGGDIYSVRDLYRAETFLDAVVVPSMTVVPDTTSGGFLADVLYTIRPGRAYRVRNIDLAGNTNTRDILLRREMLVGAGEPLRWRRVEDSRRQLLATSLFRDVTISPADVDTAAGLADLRVHVVERRPAYYELGVGVGSVERIRALAAWGHNNLWGTGRRLQVRGRGSWNVEDVVGNHINFDKGQVNYRGDISYVNPRLWHSRYSFDVTVYLQRETRGESALNQHSHGLNLGTTWRTGRRITHTTYLGVKITNPDIHPWAPDSLKARFDELGTEVSQVRSANYALYIDNRDDLFRPTAGSYAIGTFKVAGGPLGGDFDFFKWSAALHHYRRPPLGGVLALRIMAGGARPFAGSLDLGAEGVPYDDRFFAGGASTVRGYRHNSLGPQVADQDELDRLNYTSDVLLPDNPARGGNYLLLTNLEWRFPLPLLKRWHFSSVLFCEGGNVWANLSEVRMRAFRFNAQPGEPTDPGSTKAWDYRWSYGTGLRLETPFGPVRVDVGIPLKRVRYVGQDKDVKDPSVYWHFSLGYPF